MSTLHQHITTIFCSHQKKIHVYTDASGNLGYAAVYGTKWFVQPWLDIHAHYHISIKELFPIVLLVEIWGPLLCNQKVLFFSDNLPVVEIVNKQSSKDKTLMRLIRRLVVAAMKFNILFKAKHIPGKHNVLADHLSRFKFQEAKKFAPWLDPQPTTVPDHLLFI